MEICYGLGSEDADLRSVNAARIDVTTAKTSDTHSPQAAAPRAFATIATTHTARSGPIGNNRRAANRLRPDAAINMTAATVTGMASHAPITRALEVPSITSRVAALPIRSMLDRRRPLSSNQGSSNESAVANAAATVAASRRAAGCGVRSIRGDPSAAALSQVCFGRLDT